MQPGVEAMNMIIDVTEAKRRVDGDEEILRELFQIFLEEIPRMLGNVHAAVAEADAQRLMKAAHALKGSAANIAALRVARAAADLEAMGRAGDLGAVFAAYGRLEAEIEQLESVLAARSVAA
jgi:two-component system sensor histidine kinase/response regulator